MDCALFSIKPEFVSQIFEGKKRFEFRKNCCKKHIDKIVIYETYPTCKIVGEVDVTEILEATPASLWNKTCDYSGISISFFDEYFKNREKAYAYYLANPIKYQKLIALKEIGVTAAPQSFIYLTKEQYKKLNSINK